MAAIIRVLTKKEWAVFASIIDDLGSGGIVVSPHAANEFKQKTGLTIPKDAIIEDYGWCGKQTVTIDFLNSTDAYVRDEVLGYMQVERMCRCGGAMLLYSNVNSVPVFECVKCQKRES
jgi:hypothetical protein